MKELLYEDLVIMVTDVLCEVFDLDESSLCSISGLIDEDVSCDDISCIEMDVDDMYAISYDYLRSRNKLISITVGRVRASVSITLGTRCRKPEMARRFISSYSQNARYAHVWRVEEDVDVRSGLTMKAKLEYSNISELQDKLTEVFSLLTNDEFTNELRPFSHYFND